MKKRFLTYSTALVLLLSMGSIMAACSNGNSNTPAPTSTQSAPQTSAKPTDSGKNTFGAEPLKFSFYVNYGWYAPKGYGNTFVTKALKDQYKLDIEEISSNGNDAQKFGTIVASNEFPDVMQMDRGANFEKLVEQGKLVAIDPFLNDPKYPNLKKFLDPEADKMLRSKDGKLYGIPNWFGAPKGQGTQSNNKGWLVNRKIYEELGKPKLETFDDLYNYLKMVKSKYPDVVPLDTGNAGGPTVQVQNMLYVGAAEGHQIYWGKPDADFRIPNFNDKKYTSVFDDPALRESFKWTNLFFREKLLTQDTFTQKLEQFKEKLNTGKIAIAGIYDAPSHGQQANDIIQAKDPNAGYDYWPWIHKAGVNPDNIILEAGGTTGWNFNVITTSAKNPEKIFAFFDWMLSDEGIKFLNYGPKGVYYDQEGDKGVPIWNDKYKQLTSDQKANLKFGDFTPEGSWRNGVISQAAINQDASNKKWSDKAGEFYGKYNRYLGNELEGTGNYPTNSEEDTIWKTIKKINEDYVAKIVYAKSDDEFNKLFDTWKNDVNNAGYDKLLQYGTKIWASNLKKLGK
ncbi:type 2 periplasmic-binding domain-containing protein [Paenibacillus roseipurpureus]|uniref:ABC transporter substrate-binding protein n=1 Tax=Paenibacillus roseopurpureus TaxID=2918901 RepID=A0AA96LT55_9BACL|nr:hypothetical protein [Paenibacillus sp. MBLB1832]WNR46816.1 hypothetical protein MJB10_12215 [Paenibacillus sp. MBLB1832]